MIHVKCRWKAIQCTNLPFAALHWTPEYFDQGVSYNWNFETKGQQIDKFSQCWGFFSFVKIWSPILFTPKTKSLFLNKPGLVWAATNNRQRSVLEKDDCWNLPIKEASMSKVNTEPRLSDRSYAYGDPAWKPHYFWPIIFHWSESQCVHCTHKHARLWNNFKVKVEFLLSFA